MSNKQRAGEFCWNESVTMGIKAINRLDTDGFVWIFIDNLLTRLILWPST